MGKHRYTVSEMDVFVGNDVPVLCNISGVFSHVPATREDPDESETGVESIEPIEMDDDAVIEKVCEILQAEAESKAPWIRESEEHDVSQILRESIEIRWQGDAADARKVLKAFIDLTADHDRLDETLFYMANNNELY